MKTRDSNQLSDFHRERVQSVLNASPLIPVITVNHPDQAVPLCQALVDGGIRVLEITLRTPHGVKAIEQVRKAIPEAWVGAGTVTSIAQYREVESAGAQFVITPGVTEPILEFGLTSDAPLLPGVATISELMIGYNLGYREFKFFPAEVSGGIPALKAFGGPFPDVTFCPTGGGVFWTSDFWPLSWPSVAWYFGAFAVGGGAFKHQASRLRNRGQLPNSNH